MKFTKKQVNEILEKVMDAMKAADLGIENNHKFLHEVKMIREEHLLIDRRKSSLPEYASEIAFDFLNLHFSYKELMAKYHCSFRNLKMLLDELAESDERIAEEIELRKK